MKRLSLLLFFFFLPFATAQTFNPVVHNGSGCTSSGSPTVGCNAASVALSTDPANTNAITQIPVAAPANYSLLPHRNRLYTGATTRILAHYQPWFCNSSSPCNSHLNIGMDESNASQVAAQLAAMEASGIDVVNIDYYGDDSSKAYNLSVTNQVASAIAGNPAGYPKLMLTLDQGALQPAGLCPSGAGINDAQMEACIENRLDYMASHYLYQSYYETFGGKPVVPFFIDQTNWPSVVWNNVWPHVHAHVALGQSCGGGCTYTASVLILSRNSGAFTQTGLDGSFAWSQASTFDNIPSGSQLNWNGLAGYYDNFYSVARANPSKLAIGFIGKGFDDSNASFGTNKVTAEQCGQVMDLTAAKIGAAGYSAASQLPYAQVQWNDYEEGTEIETGIDPCYTMNGAIVGTTLSWTLAPTNVLYSSLSTLDHIEVLYGSSGTAMQVGVDDIPVALTGTVDISFLPPSSTFRVRAVGRPAIINPTSAMMAEPDIIPSSPVVVSGTLQSGSTSGVKGNSFVRFRLRNYAGFVPRVSGTAVLVQTQFDVKPTDTSGHFSTNLYSNDEITPNTCGVASASACTWWTIEYWIDGKVTASGNYCVPSTPTYDLNSATPCQTPPLPPAPSTGGGGTISGLTPNVIPKALTPTTIGNSALFDDGTTVGNLVAAPRQLAWGNFACTALDANTTINASCSSVQNSIILKSISSTSPLFTHGLNVYYEGNGQQSGSTLFGLHINSMLLEDANTAATPSIVGIESFTVASGSNQTVDTLYAFNAIPRAVNNVHIGRLVYYHGNITSMVGTGSTVDLVQGIAIGCCAGGGTVSHSTGISFDHGSFQYGALLSGTIANAIFDDSQGAGASGACHGTWTNTFLSYTLHDCWLTGTGSPEGVVTANVGSFFSRQDGGAGTSLYVKQSGTGNTGWAAVASGSGITGSLTSGKFPVATGATTLGDSNFSVSSNTITSTTGSAFVLSTPSVSSGAANSITLLPGGSTDASNSPGGSIFLTTTATSTSNPSGGITIGTGNISTTAGFNVGDITIQGGNATGASGANTAGNVHIIAGRAASSSGIGGVIYLGDEPSGAASGANVVMVSPAQAGQVIFMAGHGVPSGNCQAPLNKPQVTAKPVFYLRDDPASASTFLYVCIPPSTWTAITVP